MSRHETRPPESRRRPSCALLCQQSTRDWPALCQLLDPQCVYLRLFDGEGMRLSLVLSAKRKLQADTAGMEAKLRAAGAACTVSPAVFQRVCAVVQKRVSGPLDRSVRVPLLTDVHYLAAALDPKVFDPQAPDAALHVERSFEAIRVYFSRLPHVFSVEQLTGLNDDQRILLLREGFTQYSGMYGSFMRGAYAAHTPGSIVDVRAVVASPWDLWGWESLFGGSTPALREVGKVLAGMVPSSCAVERSI